MLLNTSQWKVFRTILQSGSLATIPTNSQELSADILDGGTADSNCLERLMEVSELFIERLSRSYYGKEN